MRMNRELVGRLGKPSGGVPPSSGCYGSGQDSQIIKQLYTQAEVNSTGKGIESGRNAQREDQETASG